MGKELRHLFERIDVDGSEEVSFKEFREFIKKPELDEVLMTLGIDPHDAHVFFEMIVDKHSGPDDQHIGDERMVDINFLVSSCLHLHGQASSMDMQLMRYELKMLKRDCIQLSSVIPPLSNGMTNRKTQRPGAMARGVSWPE